MNSKLTSNPPTLNQKNSVRQTNKQTNQKKGYLIQNIDNSIPTCTTLKCNTNKATSSSINFPKFAQTTKTNKTTKSSLADKFLEYNASTLDTFKTDERNVELSMNKLYYTTESNQTGPNQNNTSELKNKPSKISVGKNQHLSEKGKEKIEISNIQSNKVVQQLQNSDVNQTYKNNAIIKSNTEITKENTAADIKNNQQGKLTENTKEKVTPRRIVNMTNYNNQVLYENNSMPQYEFQNDKGEIEKKEDTISLNVGGILTDIENKSSSVKPKTKNNCYQGKSNYSERPKSVNNSQFCNSMKNFNSIKHGDFSIIKSIHQEQRVCEKTKINLIFKNLVLSKHTYLDISREELFSNQSSIFFSFLYYFLIYSFIPRK